MILLDANVLLEMLIAGRAQRDAVLDWMERIDEPYYITMLTVHLVLHFGLKDGLTLSDIRTFLADYPKAGLLPEDYVAALGLLRDKDHEDALQLAVAERLACTRIATLDRKFADTYQDRIRFVSPLVGN
ncbi:MAG TPA: type II toxin-antitoxin system VapC family toxin [Candidatus Saccharimonadales bacterium]|nr:type II toxin-antitoxin system VapC family toxin [Candidatus Saccharimonadales bacterium]